MKRRNKQQALELRTPHLIDNPPNVLASRPRRRIDQPSKLPVNHNPHLNSANSCPLNLDKIEQPRVLQFDIIRINRPDRLYLSIL
jgi:hypothetical protein